MIMSVNVKDSIEKAYRSFTPVESFVSDKTEVVVIDRPDVGKRWGRPADFEFDLSGVKQKRRQGTVTEVPRYYFENEIIDFTEQWRLFETGSVNVMPPDLLPTYIPGMPWVDYLEEIKAANAIISELNPKIQLEELQRWVCDSGITWTRMDSNGDPVANVTVYYEFSVTGFYIPFLDFPEPRMGSRGYHPWWGDL